MSRRGVIFSLSLLSGFNGAVLAEERPWGIITPFGNVMTEQRGFQGRYNPWETEIVEGVDESATEVRKQIKQGWQNIYRPRTPTEQEQWPNGTSAVKKSAQQSPKRTFADGNLTDDEQWPDRRDRYRPYQPTDRFWTPFGTFAPNVPRPPVAPYGNNYQPWQR